MQTDLVARKRLTAAMQSYERAKHPSYPDHLTMPTKSYKLNTANGLTGAIIAWIDMHGGMANRINTTGRLIDRRQTFTDVIGQKRQIGSLEWIPGTTKRGTADVDAVIQGKSVKIEVKVGKDKQSQYQIDYAEQIRSAGGIYVVARTWAGFLDWWDSFQMCISDDPDSMCENCNCWKHTRAICS